MRDTAIPFTWDTAYARRAQRMRASEIRELLKLLDQPDMLSFAGGIPDPSLFPIVAIADATASILADPAQGRAALQYSVSEGYKPLREWIVAHMGRLGVPCGVDNIVITSGSQQGLDFLGKLFLAEGQTALVTAPTYLGALQAFAPNEPRYDRLDLGGNITPTAYTDAAQAAGSKVVLTYAVPDFANPTGETMDEPARNRLLDLVAGLGVPLIEDAAYSAIRFSGNHVPSCLSLDVRQHGHIDRTRTIYCGTFSKTLSPGLRVGWICAAQELVSKIVLTKQAADLHSPSLNQMIIHRVATSEYDTVVSKVVALYAARRNAMLAALDAHFPSGTRWTRPEGGMFVWVTLPDAIDAAALLRRALEEERVAFVPGAAFFADGSGRNTLRLNYSLQPELEITDGIARLGRLVERIIREPSVIRAVAT